MMAHEVFKFETCSAGSGMLFVFIDIAIIRAALQVINQQVYFISTMSYMFYEDRISYDLMIDSHIMIKYTVERDAILCHY